MSGVTGILLLDKATGKSSQRAVHEVQRALGASKAGHGGTLDPMAEGLLPVLLGSATKLSRFLLEGDKGYEATFLPGLVTDTLDTTGQELERRPFDLSAEQIEAALTPFRGQIEQVPPMYSAISIGGKKLYKLARKGIEVERQPRAVTIYALELLGWDGREARIAVSCSKGTYIRSLIADIGTQLGCGACMSGLRRTAAAGFSVADAVTMEQLERAVAEGGADALVIRPETLFEALPIVSPQPFFTKLLHDGQRVLQPKLGSDIPPQGMARLYHEGAFFGLLTESETPEGSALALSWRE